MAGGLDDAPIPTEGLSPPGGRKLGKDMQFRVRKCFKSQVDLSQMIYGAAFVTVVKFKGCLGVLFLGVFPARLHDGIATFNFQQVPNTQNRTHVLEIFLIITECDFERFEYQNVRTIQTIQQLVDLSIFQFFFKLFFV